MFLLIQLNIFHFSLLLLHILSPFKRISVQLGGRPDLNNLLNLHCNALKILAFLHNLDITPFSNNYLIFRLLSDGFNVKISGISSNLSFGQQCYILF
jgi:hypothetical protein